MNVLIKVGDNEYYSPVLLIYNDGWKSKVLVLDSKYEKVILQDYWVKNGTKKQRTVYFLNSDQTNWVTNGKYSGIPEIMNNSNTLKNIKKNQSPPEITELAKSFYKQMEIKEWMPINNEKDVLSFVNLTYGLHDASVVSIEKNDEFTLVHYDTSWSCQILMKFYGVEKSNLIDYGPVYFDSYFEFLDNKIIFTADLCWIEEGIEHPEVVCDKIEYKLLKTENFKHKGEKHE